MAEVAKEQASQVASEAAAQAKNVVGDAVAQVSGQMREQGGAQRDKLVTTLSTLGDDLSSMANQGNPGLATDLTRQVADQARSFTARLDGRDVGDLLDDVRSFARQRPGVFLLGSLAAGVVAGRLLAGARDGIAGAQAVTPTAPPVAGPGQGATFTHSPPVGASTPGQPTQSAGYGDVPDIADGDGLSTGGRP